MYDPFILMFKLIILLSGSVRLRVVFREMLGEIFEQTWTSHWKDQASTLTTNTGRPNANKKGFWSCYRFDRGNKKGEFGICVRCRNNLVR